jgi:hypothetical protein
MRGPLFEARRLLTDTAAGVLPGLESWKPSLGPVIDWQVASSGIADALKTLDSVRWPLFGASSAMDTLGVLSQGWETHVSAMADVFTTTSDSMRKLTSALWSDVDHSGFMDRVMGGHSEALVDMLKSWSERADRGVWAAQMALRMALRTVEAVKRGDVDAVRRFMRKFLGFTKLSGDLVTSATLALLDVTRWLPEGLLALDFDPCPKLRAMTLAEHRSLKRELTDPDKPALRLCGQPLLSLDMPVKVSDEVTVPLSELRRDKSAPDPAAVYEEKDISDPRVLRLWWKFSDRERSILYEKGRPGTTWPAAAVACGGLPAEGERLRRKVNHLSKSSAAPEPAVQVVS